MGFNKAERRLADQVQGILRRIDTAQEHAFTDGQTRRFVGPLELLRSLVKDLLTEVNRNRDTVRERSGMFLG